MKYARVLLANCPEETTELFTSYYTGNYRPKTAVEPPTESTSQPTSTVQNLAAFLPLPYINIGGGSKADQAEAHASAESESSTSAPTYQIPKPRTAFSAFVDRPQEFISFLEALIRKEDLKEEDKIDLYTTLFEMYLDTASRKRTATEKEEWENKAKKLIEGKDVRSLFFHNMLFPRSNFEFLRSLSQRQMFSYFPTCPTSERVRLWCESKRVSGQIFFDHSPLPGTRKARSRP